MGVARQTKRRACKKIRRKALRRAMAEARMLEAEDPSLNDPQKLREEELLEKEKHDEDERKWLEREAQARMQPKRDDKATNTRIVGENFVWIGKNITISKSKDKTLKSPGLPSPREPSPRMFRHERRPGYFPEPQIPSPRYKPEPKTPNDEGEDAPFGSEKDKNYCSFHYKTGSCRFSSTCRRAHVYPQRSCTLLFKNMYSGPGLAWEHEEGLEYTDEEATAQFEEFYEDVHSEFIKFGELVNFKVCRNGAQHLRGNVYAHYKTEESAVAAHSALSGRYFGGKQIIAEFVAITKWRHALCGQFIRDSQTCSHGVGCNFLHCFKNPGGAYGWADWDKPPPRDWRRKMAALFGYTDTVESEDEEHRDRGRRSGSRSRLENERRRSSSRDRRSGSRKRSREDGREQPEGEREGRRKRAHYDEGSRREGSRKRDDEDRRKYDDRRSSGRGKRRIDRESGEDRRESDYGDERRSERRMRRYEDGDERRNGERRSSEYEESYERRRSRKRYDEYDDSVYHKCDPSDRWQGGL